MSAKSRPGETLPGFGAAASSRQASCTSPDIRSPRKPESARVSLTGNTISERERRRMAITIATGEALTGEGNELAHIDLVLGSKTGPVGEAFASAWVNNKDGFTNLMAVVTPNLPAKPDTILTNKVTIKGAKQAVQ